MPVTVLELIPDATRGAAPDTILVVDDEPTVRHIVRRMLVDEGFDSLEAHSAEAALGVLEREASRIGVVITDVIMPELDGCALGRRIRERWPRTPVLYASAYTPEELFAQGICTDDLPFLRKPFTADELIRRVRELRIN
ncbi:MAG: response regulator [Gemmatimonadales bacterium]|nr:response regulator [Gemmatimonadales bacterium]